MGGLDEFNYRHTQTAAENEPYNQYEYQTEENESWAGALPVKQGLYDPGLEKDACGVGFAWYTFHISEPWKPCSLYTSVTSRVRRATKL